ncbi:AGAP012002-PA, partial [Anopheles gambiae str. PEST]
CAITRQVPLALRPFGGLYNPYSKGCSVLCNHPAAQEVKNVVRLAKDAWITEAKADGRTRPPGADGTELPDHVPEEFFRRYTDTDSRPLTPTPTVASGRTRASVGGSHLARRCVTPEPQTANGQERKQLILDLRRSHSQETLYWNASSELSPSQLHDGGGGVGGSLALGYGGERGERGPAGSSSAGGAGGGPNAQSASDTERGPPQPMTCINAMDDGEEDPPRRRGKRRKKSKQLTQTISFVPNQDPETQIAKMDPDSPNYSARPSLVPTGKCLLASRRTSHLRPASVRDCFLDDESLGLLRRGLNIDIVEMIFERYVTFRTATMDKLNFQTDAVRTLQRSAKQLSDVDYEKWIDLPRKYSRSSARFELPIDTRKLTRMTPIEYLHDHVVLSNDRKQLYHRIFARNLPREEPKASGALESVDSDSLPETETGPLEVDSTRNLLADVTRYIPMNCFDKALHEALGFHGTAERIAAIRELLELNYDPFNELQIDFRTWCGIVAFSERFINSLDREQDPCDELEMVDFESLERRVRWARPSENLCQVLQIIKYH